MPFVFFADALGSMGLPGRLNAVERGRHGYSGVKALEPLRIELRRIHQCVDADGVCQRVKYNEALRGVCQRGWGAVGGTLDVARWMRAVLPPSACRIVHQRSMAH